MTRRNSSGSTGCGWLAKPMKSCHTWFDSRRGQLDHRFGLWSQRSVEGTAVYCEPAHAKGCASRFNREDFVPKCASFLWLVRGRPHKAGIAGSSRGSHHDDGKRWTAENELQTVRTKTRIARPWCREYRLIIAKQLCYLKAH